MSLMTCFADINVSLGSVATYARCAGIFNMHLTANLPRNLSVKRIVNRLRFDGIMVTSLWPRFFGPPCVFTTVVGLGLFAGIILILGFKGTGF